MSFSAKVLGFVGAGALPSLYPFYISPSLGGAFFTSFTASILPTIAATSSQEFYEDAKTGHKWGSYIGAGYCLVEVLLLSGAEPTNPTIISPKLCAIQALLSIVGNQLMPAVGDQIYDYFNPIELSGEQTAYISDSFEGV
jgi:hypothetical protein